MDPVCLYVHLVAQGKEFNMNKKEMLVGLAIVAGLVLVFILWSSLERPEDMAVRRSEECAREGYNGIEKHMTKEGDVWFSCTNYPTR